ncbi:hypothetical protein BDV95DRAFT_615612 [Massariosphaeria phaeospora]|uniref:Uncharacterized protein n=1 Tax=Massariosphaeria phaeospora TaxID=100035 RepID=A0A7C8MFV7_9PLEO|nr:hypothetical protein BDV95DRAFT_615612 [Massariosphaeria phaeospora]
MASSIKRKRSETPPPDNSQPSSNGLLTPPKFSEKQDDVPQSVKRPRQNIWRSGLEGIKRPMLEDRTLFVSRDDDGTFHLRFGKGDEHTLEEVIATPELCINLVCDKTIDSHPDLHEALSSWASAWKMPKGGLYEKPDYNLKLAAKYYQEKDDYEEPGSKYILAFGKHKGQSLKDVEPSYISWLKRQESLPEGNWEPLVEALEYHDKQERLRLPLRYPQSASYRVPLGKKYKGRLITDVPESYIDRMITKGIPYETSFSGERKYPGLASAIQYWDKMKKTERAHWSRAEKRSWWRGSGGCDCFGSCSHG